MSARSTVHAPAHPRTPALYNPAPELRITFLGTAAARPTVGRNVSSLVVQREGELMMFDCGEGTQRQMMRYGTGFALGDIFFSHLHADHFLGVIGLLRTMGLQGREEPIRLWTPPRAARRCSARRWSWGWSGWRSRWPSGGWSRGRR